MIESEESSSDDIIRNKSNQEARNLEFVEKSDVTKIVDRWAIIIGISKYQDSSLNLKYADRDAEEFYNILTQIKEEFFKADHVEKLINEEASYSKINKALKGFLKKPGNDDLVLIYFACHGAFDPDRPKETYVLPYDTNPLDIASTSIHMDDIGNSIRRNLNAKRVVIIADACHSAAIGGDMSRRTTIIQSDRVNRFLNELANSNEGTALLTSAEAREVALEDERWGGGHGVFTHYLIEGMKGEADGYGGGKKDGIISIGELFEYVRFKVEEATDHRQHPSVGTSQYDRRLPLIYLESLKEQEFVAKHTMDQAQVPTSAHNTIAGITLKWMEAVRYEKEEDYESALNCYDEAIRIDPNYEASYNRKGLALVKLGNYKEALKCYDKALEIDPNSLEFFKNRALALYDLKEYKDAITDFDKYLEQKPNDRKILKSKSEAARNLKAEDDLKEGILLYDSGNYNEAIPCFGSALEVNPKNTQALHYKGLTLSSLSRFDEAISFYDEAPEQIDPKMVKLPEQKKLAINEQSQVNKELEFDALLKQSSDLAENRRFKINAIIKDPECNSLEP